MNPFIIIAFIIMLYALVNYRNAFVCFLCFRLFLNLNINIYIPGFPLLQVEFLMVTYFLILYKITKENRTNLSKYDASDYPLKKATILFVVVDLITVIFSLGGIVKCLPPTLMHINDMLIGFVAWKVLTRNYFDILIKGLLVICTISCIYALYEKQIGMNPLIRYEIQLAGDKSTDWTYGLNEFRGYRVQSIFNHPIGAGANFAFLGYLFLYIVKFSDKLKRNYYLLGIGFFSLVCCVFANSRGPVVYLILASIPLFDLRNKKILFLTICAIGLVSFIGVFSEYSDMVSSIFDIENKKGYVGSDKAMRMGQFQAAYTFFLESPIWGLGERGYEYHHSVSTVHALLGLESIWIKLLVEKGLLGIIAYVYFIFSVCNQAKNTVIKKTIILLMVAYVALDTVTTIPGAYPYLHYLIILFLLKEDKRWGVYK